MMNNLFSMFDPSTNMFSFNWLIMLMPLGMIPKNFYFLPNRSTFIKITLMKHMKKDLKNNMSKDKFNNMIIFMTILSFIYISNITSILPYTFTSTSHMAITMTLSFPFWLMMMMKSWMKQPNKMLTHLVPSSTPMTLIPFMVLIETISSLIRPATLSIRLTANMISGHILLALLSNTLNKSMFMFMSMMSPLMLLTMLELAVCFIQAYVFMTLLSLYLNEM